MNWYEFIVWIVRLSGIVGKCAAVGQCAAVRAAICGSAHHSRVHTVRAAVCDSALGSSVRQFAQQCAAVRQCGRVRPCAAVCGNYVRQYMCGSVRQCAAVRAAVCGLGRSSVHGSVRQCALRISLQHKVAHNIYKIALIGALHPWESAPYSSHLNMKIL
jgi:hypothetical protein